MAAVGLERIMDRVSLVFDCASDEEATRLYNLLASQALDGCAFHIQMSHEQEVKAEGLTAPAVRRPQAEATPTQRRSHDQD